VKRAALAALVVLGLVVPFVAAGGAVASGHDDGAASLEQVNETETPAPTEKASDDQAEDSDAPTFEELKRRGKQFESAPASMRFLGSYSSATVRVNPVGPGSDGWSYLEPGQEVNSNEVQLRTVRLAPEDELDRTLNVTVVAWQQGEKTVKEGNTTRTVTVAKNVTVHRQQIEAGRGYGLSNITLPDHYDETFQITMWVEEHPDARWRFEHQSVETTKGLPFPATWGGYWQFTATNVLIWIVGMTGAVAVTVPAAIKKTGRGTGYGVAFWGIVLTIGGSIIGVGGYVWTANLLSAAPPVIGFVIAGVIGVVMLETIEHGVYDVGLVRLFTSDKKNPRGDIVKEAEGGEMETLTLAQTADGVKAISPGIRPFIARLWTGGTELRGVERLEFEFDLGSPEISLTSPVADKLIFVDDEGIGEDDQLLYHEAEGIAFELPIRVRDEETGEMRTNWAALGSIAFNFVVPAALALRTFQYLELGGARIAALVAGVVVVYVAHLVPKEGTAEFLPAVGMTEDAVATAMQMESEIDDYETLEAAIGALVDERNTSDEILKKIEELDAESVVKESASRDKSPGEFVEGSAPTAAGGDD